MKSKKTQIQRTWFVIADGARARIFRNDHEGRRPRPALAYDLTAPHLATSELISDRPGRYADRGGLGNHAFTPRTDRHELEKVKFAEVVAETLDHGAAADAFDRLVVVAPPAMIGRLRAAMTTRTRERLFQTIGKDLSGLMPAIMLARLRTLTLFGAPAAKRLAIKPQH